MGEGIGPVPGSGATARGAEQFEIAVHVRPDGVRVELVGDIDGVTAPKLSRRIEGFGSRFEHLELDLAQVPFLSSAGIVAFTVAATGMRAGGRMSILHAREGVHRLLAAVTLPACVDVGAAAPPPPPHDGEASNHGITSLIAERNTLEQATGVVAEESGVDIPDARSALHAYAHDADRSLNDVASSIVATQDLAP